MREQTPARIALAGAGGFGRTHLHLVQALHEAGLARLVAVCDVSRPDPEVAGWLSARSIPWFAEFDRMMTDVATEVVVIATPPQFHAGMLCTAYSAGCDALVEKPPVVTVAQFDEVEAAGAGHLCQVGFQALGSWAVPRLRHLVDSGELGRVDLVSAGGCWVRGDRYYLRAPWAGRRMLGGWTVNDGALTNAFAHAVNACLAVAGVERLGEARVAADLYRAHDIEGHDTGSVRVELPGHPTVLVAVTLCASETEDPWLMVRGDRGRVRWEYLRDSIEVRDAGGERVERGPRMVLLKNLLAVRSGAAPDLLAPFSRQRAFVELCDRLLASPVREVPESAVRRRSTDGDRLTEIVGVAASTKRAAENGLLYRETGAAWLT